MIEIQLLNRSMRTCNTLDAYTCYITWARFVVVTEENPGTTLNDTQGVLLTIACIGKTLTIWMLNHQAKHVEFLVQPAFKWF